MAHMKDRSDTGSSTSNPTGSETGDAVRTAMSRWQKLVGVIGLAVVLWVVNDLADIVTSGGRRGPSGQVTPDGQPPPAGSHDPSSFDHGQRP